MKTRTFQSNEISEIGLVGWQLGGDWGEVGDETALEILRAARQSGVSFLDTAAGYGSGRSERLIGQFLKETDDAPLVATKVGRLADVESDVRKHLRASAVASRERLGVDALDLLQLHCWPQAQLDLPATW
jgi:aryl-alcohol dehydrogenase-like predicted oxidoreductase